MMKRFVLSIASVLACAHFSQAQPGRELPPIVVSRPTQLDRGHSECFRLLDVLQQSICDAVEQLSWRSYSETPSAKPYTSLIPQFHYVVIRRTEQSGNGWSVQPLQFFPELSRFAASHSQAGYDVRTRAIYGLKLTGILCDTGEGQEKLARGSGLMMGKSDHLLFESGSTSSVISGGSHRSTFSATESDTTWLTEDQLVQGAVKLMIADLHEKLTKKGYAVASRGGPPDQPLVKDLAGISPTQLTSIKGSRFVAECRDPGRCANGSCGAYDCKVPFSLKEGKLYCQLPNYQGRQLHFYK